MKQSLTLILLTACSAAPASIPTPDAAPPRPAFLLHYGPTDVDDPTDVAAYTIKPGAEPSTCVSLAGPTEPVWFDGYKSDWTLGMHHFALYANTTLAAGPPIPCNTPSGNVFLTLQEPHLEALALSDAPEYAGLAVQIEPGKVAANVHSINTTDYPITIEGDLAFYLAEKPSSPSLQAGPIKGNWPPLTSPLSIPARTTAEVVVQCKMGKAAKLVRVWGHQHAHGVSFDLLVDGVSKYRSTDWEHPPVQAFDSTTSGDLELKVGAALELRCVAKNDTAQALPVGPSAIYTAEMCALMGTWTPFLPGYFPCR